MTRLLLVWLAAAAAGPALAQHQGQGPADEPHDVHPMQHQEGSQRRASPPPAAFSGPAHAADTLFDPRAMAAAREQLRMEHGASSNYLVLADRFEVGAGGGEGGYLWDLQGWYGGDTHKLWLKSEGGGDLGEPPESAELQALYSRAIRPFFDVQVGIRHDVRPDPQRSHLVLGLQGLMPYAFEIDAAVFLSDEGDLTGRLEGELDVQIGQRVILQPRVELNLAARAMPELEIGSGLGSIEAGFRLRYEIRREFAPYVGIGWERMLGGTGDFARAAGEDRARWAVVAGVRSWF